MPGAVVPLALLDAPHLADALRGGIHRVFAHAEHLNKINVFPVPDGDTGTNLAMTLRAVLVVVEKDARTHAGALLTRCADAAIDGARGNSGAIFAQFLLGVGDRAGPHEKLSATDFAAAVDAGAKYARDAMTEPREGTMLTVLAAFARELKRLTASQPGPDFASLFASARPALDAALEGTRGQLDVLRDADVVDAGAQGFVDFIDGLQHYLATGEVNEADAPLGESHESMALGGADATHRFCTECVVSGSTVEPRKLRERLFECGSSLVVAGTHKKARVHIHTNDPEHVFRVLEEFGTLSAQKADDMIAQTAAAHHARQQRVAVVTDSAADIPEEELGRLQIHLVPLRVHFGAHSYLDKVSLSPDDFYRELERGAEHPKTSQPPPGDFRRMYEFLLSHFESVVSISLTAKVSGTYNAARTAVQRVPSGRVTLIDSENASLGQGLVAMLAAEYAMAGYSAVEVAAATRESVHRTVTFGLLGRLDFAVRGGRLPVLVGKLASLLHVAPILMNHPGGKISAGGVLFGTKHLRRQFAAFVRRRIRADRRYRISVGHANADSEGRQLLEEITAGLSNIESAYLTALGTALGVHGGPGMLVVGLQDYVSPRGGPSR